MATKRHNIPEYGKNLRKSATYMAQQIAVTTMPNLSNTVVTAQTSFNDLRQFTIRNKSKFKAQKKLSDSTLLRSANEIINNAKEDLKSGKFYNADRAYETETQNMSEFLEFGYDDNDIPETGPSNDRSASFNNFLASTSANSMAGARAISENQTKTAEYLGEIQQTNHVQNLMLNNRYHLETMGKLDNIQKLAKSIVDFNVNTMQDHIRGTHEFYATLLNKLDRMDTSIVRMAKGMDSRYGNGKRKSPTNDLDNIFGGGFFNINEYFSLVKKNVKKQTPFSKDMIKMLFDGFKSSPISSIANMFLSVMMPKKMTKTGKNIDDLFQGAFAKYLGKMGDWKRGNTGKSGWMHEAMRILGAVLSPDNTNKTNRPDLSRYRDQSISVDLELKKAKAITEVIPQYLAEITKKLTGKDMLFNYTKGEFVNPKATRRELDRDRNRSLAWGMDRTREMFNERMDIFTSTANYSEADRNMMAEDIDAFLAWVIVNEDYKPRSNSDIKFYKTLVNKGLRLRGGYRSYKIIEGLWLKIPSNKRAIINKERKVANVDSSYFNDRFNQTIIDSGMTSVYNGFNDYSQKARRFDSRSSLESDLDIVNKLGNMSPAEREKWIKEYKKKQQKEQSKKKTEGQEVVSDAFDKLFKDATNNVPKSLKSNLFTKLFDKIDGRINGIVDSIGNRLFADEDFGDAQYNSSEDYEFDSRRPTAVVRRVVRPKSSKSNTTKVQRVVVKAKKKATSAIPNRDYFAKTDSHMNHGPRFVYSSFYDAMTFENNTPLLVRIAGGSPQQGTNETTPPPINTDGSINFSAIVSSVLQAGSKAKGKIDKGFSSLKSKISSVGGNINDHIKGIDFKNLLSGMKDSVKSGGKGILGGISDFLGNIKEMTKKFTSPALKKGKGMLVGSMVSSLIGIGPVPGAVIGALFSKNKKNKTEDNENKDAEDTINEINEKVKGSKGKRKSVLLGAGISSMLGLGPVPGAVITMMMNKHRKKKIKEEEKQGENIEETANEIEKKKQGIGKLAKGKNIALGAMASSMLGLGPVPGILAASLYNKTKKKKTKEEKQEEKETNASIGVGGKVKNFFGKGKNLAIGTAASTLLGLGPIPGIIGASLYNKSKYKNNKSKTARQIAKIQRMKKYDEAGKQSEADRLEDQTLQEAKATGDIESLSSLSNIVANYRNAGTYRAIESKTYEPEKGKGLFSLLGDLLGKSGLGTTLLAILGTLLGIKAFVSGSSDGDISDRNGNLNMPNLTGIASTGAAFVASKFIPGASALGNGLYTGVGHAMKSGSEFKQGNIGAGLAEAGKFGKSGLAVATKLLLKNSVRKSAVKSAKKAIVKNAAGAVAQGAVSRGLVEGLSRMFERLATSGIVNKLVPSLAPKLSRMSSSLSAEIGTMIGKRAMQQHGAKTAMSALNGVADYIPIGNFVVNGIFAVGGFVNGWFNVKNILKLDSSYDPPLSLKWTSAIVSALDASLGNGFLDLFTLRDDLVQLIFKAFASDADRAEYEEAKASQRDAYEVFLNENPGTNLSFEKYNNITNKKWYSKAFDGVKGFFGGKVDNLDNYRTNKNPININYDESQTTNVITNTGGGSGGRGPSLSNKSSYDIIRSARSQLTDSLTSGKITRVKEADVEKYSRVVNEKKKEPNVFTKIGSAVSGAAKWIVNGVVSGFNWLKDKFTGSGGRGKVDESNYYNQGDPRWGNQSFGRYKGKRDTLKAGGCGPTVAAMALQELSGRKILPSMMGELALNSGYKYNDGGTDPSFFNKAASIMGMNAATEKGIGENAIRALAAGRPVPIMGKGGAFGKGQHYLLANGMDKNGNVQILDPQNKSNNRIYNIRDLNRSTSVSTIFYSRGIHNPSAGRGSAEQSRFAQLAKEAKNNMGSQKKGYSQSKYTNVKVNGNSYKTRTDCSGYVGTVLKAYGVGSKSRNWTSASFKSNGNGVKDLKKAGFQQKSTKDTGNFKEGDILVYNGHVEIFAYKKGNDIYVYNYGSNKSGNNPGVTKSGHKASQITNVWSLSNSTSSAPAAAKPTTKKTTTSSSSSKSSTKKSSSSSSSKSSNSSKQDEAIVTIENPYEEAVVTIEDPGYDLGYETDNYGYMLMDGGPGQETVNQGPSGTMLENIINGISINSPLNSTYASLLVGASSAYNSGSSGPGIPYAMDEAIMAADSVINESLDGSNSSSSSSSSGSTTSTGSTKSSSLSNKSARINKIYSELTKAGMSRNGALAVLANMQGESNFNTEALGDKGTSYGLCQWHNSRWTSLKNYCAKNGLDASSIEGQVSYLVKEFKDYGLWGEFSSGNKSAVSLTDTMVRKFERPKYPDSESNKRQKYLNELDSIAGRGGRGSSIGENFGRASITTFSKTMDKNSPIKVKTGITVNKTSLNPSNRKINIPTTQAATSVTPTKDTDGFDNRLMSIFTQMVELLTEIKDSNSVISQKEFSPKILSPQVSGSNNGVIPAQTQKSNILDSIISGI